jgi:hypothetical protein
MGSTFANVPLAFNHCPSLEETPKSQHTLVYTSNTLIYNSNTLVYTSNTLVYVLCKSLQREIENY